LSGFAGGEIIDAMGGGKEIRSVANDECTIMINFYSYQKGFLWVRCCKRWLMFKIDGGIFSYVRQKI
jgi:hypothetical protein